MISDFVKGKKQFDYPENIQKGIRLHRAIDTFTDTHAATKEAKKYFKESVGLYAGAFVDVVYDHFLANDKNEFPTDDSLLHFTGFVYKTLQQYETFLPQRFGMMFPYMQEQNWLYNYRFKWGIEKSFAGLVRRAAYLSSYKEAFQAFEENYDALNLCYQSFFLSVKKNVQQLVQQL
jgi:acyl carrier protein phosphodiesterase